MRALTCFILALPLPLALTGCKIVTAIGLLTTPPQIAKPEFQLTEERLAIVMECARPEQADPVFEAALHKRIVELFRENKVPSQVVPHEAVIALRQANPDFRTWSIQQIGRRLHAEQVLYLRILHLRLGRLQEIVTPEVELRIKLIGTQEPAVHARLWPGRDAEPDGRSLAHHRQPAEMHSVEVIDSETVKLARDTAYYVARHFHRYDTEKLPPREP